MVDAYSSATGHGVRLLLHAPEAHSDPSPRKRHSDSQSQNLRRSPSPAPTEACHSERSEESPHFASTTPAAALTPPRSKTRAHTCAVISYRACA